VAYALRNISLLPRRAEPLPVLVEMRAAGVGELVDRAALARLAANQAFVREELERGIDRAGARAPGALAPLLELLHHLVAVPRLLFEQKQDRGADVAAAHPPAAVAEARAEPGVVQPDREGRAGRTAGPHVEVEEAISLVHNEIGYRYIVDCQGV